jgi:hypothetical protein
MTDLWFFTRWWCPPSIFARNKVETIKRRSAGRPLSLSQRSSLAPNKFASHKQKNLQTLFTERNPRLKCTRCRVARFFLTQHTKTGVNVKKCL